jgi:hypothetical protein
MPWNTSRNAGFCAAWVQPWHPLGADARDRNVAVQRADGRARVRRAGDLPVAEPHRVLCSSGMDRDGVVDGEVALRRGEALVLAPGD